jgi:hypothetical protein
VERAEQVKSAQLFKHLPVGGTEATKKKIFSKNIQLMEQRIFV